MQFVARLGWGLGGLLFLTTVAWLLSADRRRFPWRVALWGVGLQAFFAWLILMTPPGRWLFEGASALVRRILGFTDAGAAFLFGNLYKGLPGPGNPPYMLYDPAQGMNVPTGFVFALHVLMTIVFFGSLMAVLYHLGVMQLLIRAIARVMRHAMGTSGSETLCCAANIFVGQTEAPLVIKPYVERMTRSELMAVMTGGFATIAGGVMAAYSRMGMDPGHLLTASVMSAPAALVFAKIMIPETESSETAGTSAATPPRTSVNVIDAAAGGAADGMRLALNVAAMLMAFVALVAMIDAGLGWLGSAVGMQRPLSLATIFGTIFAPFALMMGIPWSEAPRVGELLGTQVSINELVAYVKLADLRETLSPRSFEIATYALCGFANLGSVAIQIGGISALVPARRGDLARLGLRAMLAGAFACWQTATIAGVFIDPDQSAERRREAAGRADWTARRLDFQEQIDAYEKQIRDYPGTELARQAHARIAALRAEAKAVYRRMNAVAQRLWTEGRRDEAMAIYGRVAAEFTTEERAETYLKLKSEANLLVHPAPASPLGPGPPLDPKAAHPVLKALVERYGRGGGPDYRPVAGEDRLEALDRSERAADLQEANVIRLMMLDAHAIEELWLTARSALLNKVPPGRMPNQPAEGTR